MTTNTYEPHQQPANPDEAPVPGERPWYRLPGEPSLWFDRFRRYLRMGPKRSLLRLANEERAKEGKQKSNKIGGAISRASDKYHWKYRAERFDVWQAERTEARWLARQDELREQEWSTSKALLDKVTQMLKFPLAATTQEQTVEGGKTIIRTTVHPIRWTMRDAGILSEIATRQARLASGLATSHRKEEHTGAGGEPLVAPPVIYLPDNSRGDTDGVTAQPIPPAPKPAATDAPPATAADDELL